MRLLLSGVVQLTKTERTSQPLEIVPTSTKMQLATVPVEIETSQLAPFLLLDLVDFELRKQHAALGMVRMGQREETSRIQTPFLDLLRAQLRKLVPACTAGEFDSDALLNCLAPGHFDTLGRAIAQVIALLQQRHVPLHDLWLSRSHAIHDGREALVNVDRHVTRRYFAVVL